MPVAVPVRDEDLPTLEAWTRAPSVSAGAALRARIVLACAAGEGTSQVARQLGISRPTVIAWRERYRAGGLAALADAPPRAGPRPSMRPRSSRARWSRRLLAWG